MAYICEFCGKTFSTKYNLNTHIKTAKKCISTRKASEIQIQLHSCNFCSKGFTRQDYLQSHIKTCPKKVELERDYENAELKKLCDQLKSENASLKEQVQHLKEENTQLIQRPNQIINNNNNYNIKIKLSEIETKNSKPLTVEFIREKTRKDYPYDNFIQGINELNKFVESIVVLNPKELKLCPYKAGLNYVCTDKTNHEFYSLRPWAEAASAPLGARVG